MCRSAVSAPAPGSITLCNMKPSRHPAQAAKPGWVFFFGRAILRPVLWLRYRPIITGTEHIPATGPVLLTSNHLHLIDTILIPSFASRKVQFLAKESLFTGTVKGWFFRRVGAVPVYREAGSATQAALDAGKAVLDTGGVFAIFPEGARSKTGMLNRGRTGAAWLSLSSGATVVPVGLIGTDRKRAARGKRPRVQVNFGAPVPLDDLVDLPAGRARREATERIMAAIQALSGQDRAEAYATGGRGS